MFSTNYILFPYKTALNVPGNMIEEENKQTVITPNIVQFISLLF